MDKSYNKKNCRSFRAITDRLQAGTDCLERKEKGRACPGVAQGSFTRSFVTKIDKLMDGREGSRFHAEKGVSTVNSIRQEGVLGTIRFSVLIRKTSFCEKRPWKVSLHDDARTYV